jgi:hypothetical protein
MLVLNESVCITAAWMIGGLNVIGALNDCQELRHQDSGSAGMQDLIHCLRGLDVDNDGRKDCLADGFVYPPDVPEAALNAEHVLHVVPDDFAAIDVDADQVHAGQGMEIMAFVSGDSPVTFETYAGTFASDGKQVQPAYICDGQDPDCDGNAATKGDGVVVARLTIRAEDARGIAHVTATQANVEQVQEITIVGIPESIVFEPIDGKDTIETGATAPSKFGETPLPTACDFPGVEAALQGTSAPQKTDVLVKALDSDGHEVAGAVLSWDHAFAGTHVPPDVGPTKQGGVALPLAPMWDLGAAGIGFPQVVCGGKESGDFVSGVRFFVVLDTQANAQYSALLTVHVVLPATVTPTATQTATQTPTPTATATETRTAVPTATDTVVPVTRTPGAQGTVTVLTTGTAEATRTVVVAGMPTVVVPVTETVVVPVTETVVASATETPTVTATPSVTLTATGTATPTMTATPTATATGMATGTATRTVTATATTVPRTATPGATSTRAAGTATVVATATGGPSSSVLGAAATPRPRGVVLPATGGGSGAGGVVRGLLMLAVAGVLLGGAGIGWARRWH